MHADDQALRLRIKMERHNRMFAAPVPVTVAPDNLAADDVEPEPVSLWEPWKYAVFNFAVLGGSVLFWAGFVGGLFWIVREVL